MDRVRTTVERGTGEVKGNKGGEEHFSLDRGGAATV